MDDDRIDLETKVTMLERTVEALSGELAEHQRQLEFLRRNLELCVEQLKQRRSSEPIEPHDTPPPHWGG